MDYLNQDESILELFIYETEQQLEQLEGYMISFEKEDCYTVTSIHDIFRIMHTIKGSAAMMMIHNLAQLAHSMEDIFSLLREQPQFDVDSSRLSDLVFESIDFMKTELEKIKNKDSADGNPEAIINNLKEFMSGEKRIPEAVIHPIEEHIGKAEAPQERLEKREPVCLGENNLYRAVISYEEGCEMENIRAFSTLRSLKEISSEVYVFPEDILDNEESALRIRREGFHIFCRCNHTYEEMWEFFNRTIFLKDLELEQLVEVKELYPDYKAYVDRLQNSLKPKEETALPPAPKSSLPQPEQHQKQSIISVSVNKLDLLMDLVGEMVIAEAMVIQNPDLAGLELTNFRKASRQLHKITTDIQDMVMSIRMVPLSASFLKMHRIIRDMSRKLSKEIQLEMIGEETEVDKNIIEHISDPLMHLVRNAADHGIEPTEDRRRAGKESLGTITLEARNVGRDVHIVIRDDGRGLDKAKILGRARKQGLLHKKEEDMTEREIYQMILMPGFSTKDRITEYSGRGVGMDVVMKNIEMIGGTLSVDSTAGQGTEITLKIPLTLAIIHGMNVRVGQSCYTIPIAAVRESFRAEEKDIFRDPDNNEFIMVRGRCYPIIKLHKIFGVPTKVRNYEDGIILIVEFEDKEICLFADELLGQQQVVVKALPEYIRNYKKTKEFSGCTLLGDGSISLILDVSQLMNAYS